jgi:hypothetical protein
MQYAIIEARQSEAGPGSERFVIAYRNQQSLHDVIAEPRIIALGFSSREEAAASNTAHVSVGPTTQVPRATVVEAVEKQHDGFHWTKWRRDRRGEGSVFERLGGFFVASYSAMVTSAFVIFSSSNALSAAIRMAVGSSA